MNSRICSAGTVGALLATGAAVVLTVGLASPVAVAKPGAGNGVRTQIVIADFNCFEGAAPGIYCHGDGGLNSNKEACSGNRKLQVLWNGDKVASTKTDGAISSWSVDDFPLPGAGTFTILAPEKHAGSVTCKKAKRSFTVDAEGITSLE